MLEVAIWDTYSVYNKGVYYSIQLLSHSLIMSNMGSLIQAPLNQTDVLFVLWIENCLVCQSFSLNKIANAIILGNATLRPVFRPHSTPFSFKMLPRITRKHYRIFMKAIALSIFSLSLLILLHQLSYLDDLVAPVSLPRSKDTIKTCDIPDRGTIGNHSQPNIPNLVHQSKQLPGIILTPLRKTISCL